jgi:RNA-directed DNA polymerase
LIKAPTGAVCNIVQAVISPVLANLFLHYAFDDWMRRQFAAVPFERYADDIIVHCRSLKQAEFLRDEIADRLRTCNLELHPENTKIVYCKDDDRPGRHENEKFDFLGFTFRPRLVKGRQGNFFVGFTPAISEKAAKAIRQTIRQWKLDRQIVRSLTELAAWCNPMLRGWINYYGRFRHSALYRVFHHLDEALARWARTKYKRLKTRRVKSQRWLRGIAVRQPQLFAHWQLGRKLRTAE